MGKGNVCVYGPYEGLYYIDNDDIMVYRKENEMTEEHEFALLGDLSLEDLASGNWVFDYFESNEKWESIKQRLIRSIRYRFKSFEKSNVWIDRDRQAFLENQLFYVAVEDNEWSYAIELIQKESLFDSSLEGLQKKHYQTYLDGIRSALFEQFEEVGIYCGPWTSGRMRREQLAA